MSPATWSATVYAYPWRFRPSCAATGPLCRCGSHMLVMDWCWRWRCTRGHFARPMMALKR